ncbi:molybdopterin binding oxidoreductase [Mollisia scopiformis]|uniref:Molybdopterin binding oxidoreductase n=1 Tax=Mollisia scopiformis TaxID=149040 RepID=A0A194X0K2_MOLSC|nr:molybdopterin binding oxidoreductase [Mollisia scopiformis]KUJ13726.1 molybdopterin binding oxidoreductase [Mollisia scopiformis]
MSAGIEAIKQHEIKDEDRERKACLGLDPAGFYIRHPPPPHELTSFITPDSQLFHTIHMGGAIVDLDSYKIVVDGLVKNPLQFSLLELKQFPSKTITAFHECYGSPLNPPTTNVWRIGNVKWTGVPLKCILELAQPFPEAKFVWSDGLDYGSFGGVTTDRYQKDLPIEKAMSDEVLLAYEMNGSPLSRKRGGPVRLIAPGWFGTNMTKWICRISLQAERAGGPFTTKFYNEVHSSGNREEIRPVWDVEPNSMIVNPADGAKLQTNEVEVWGWAWSADGIVEVEVSLDEGTTFSNAEIEARKEFSWQRFQYSATFPSGSHSLMARATSTSGAQQPVSGRRNHVHIAHFTVEQ